MATGNAMPTESDPRPGSPLTGGSGRANRPVLQPLKPVRYASTPSYEGLDRHHHRSPIVKRQVKETLNARSEYTTSQDDGKAEHRINQYVIKQEIGRGSFGAVHLAADQYGNEYAVKEFSKSRLRKRAQSHLLRRPRGPSRSGTGFNSPLHRQFSDVGNMPAGKAVDLIKEEIAIMKKLNHNNLVSLIEVLDDPAEDSLYMVMEMCKKGVVMKVGLEEKADPYEDERCRCWFRDLILGMEYLHAQGIVHRDIKPDNCLVTSDDVLKVVDFGVSEMFEKDSDMITAKSAGSPAFLPPELCVVKHGDVSGKATDIWSMGVTLYCLRYGRLPFEKESIFELYEAIKNDEVICEGETDARFQDLMLRLLEKDPAKRIEMPELREHPWVTKDGLDPLLPESENTAAIIQPPTEEEMNSAITRTVGNLLAVIKAVKKFKRLLDPNREEPPMQSILGQDYEAHFVEAPLEMEPEEDFSISENIAVANKSQSLDTYNRVSSERYNVMRGYHQQHGNYADSTSANTDTMDTARRTGPGESDESRNTATPLSGLSRSNSTATKRSVEGTRGHARDPLEEEFPFLHIGPSTYTGSSEEDSEMGEADPAPIFDEPESTLASESHDTHMTEHDENGPVPVVSESPGAAEFDIYETAYRRQIERIRQRTIRRGTAPKMYLTRRVDGKDDMKRLVQPEEDESKPKSNTAPELGSKMAVPSSSDFGSAVSMIRAQLEEQKKNQQEQKEEGQGQGHVETQTQVAETAASSQSEQQPTTTETTSHQPSPTEGSRKEDQPSPPENPRSKLRCLMGRVRGS